MCCFAPIKIANNRGIWAKYHSRPIPKIKVSYLDHKYAHIRGSLLASTIWRGVKLFALVGASFGAKICSIVFTIILKLMCVLFNFRIGAVLSLNAKDEQPRDEQGFAGWEGTGKSGKPHSGDRIHLDAAFTVCTIVPGVSGWVIHRTHNIVLVSFTVKNYLWAVI